MAAFPAFSIRNEPKLAERTSMGLGGPAIAEVRIHASEGFLQLTHLLRVLGGRMAVLGRGTNVIAGDGGHALVLVTQEGKKEPEQCGEDAGYRLVRADAGMRLPLLLSYAAKQGLGGLEGLAGIPGSVGGAVAGNAGSFGVEIGALVHSMTVFSPMLGLVEKTADECSFAYRSCRIQGMPGPFVITEVVLRLASTDAAQVKQRMDEFFTRKKAGQPIAARSAGCVFKNPAPDAPAGRLLDEAGLRGHTEGGMAFSSVHANFLVNEGNGTFAQAEHLISLAKERVLQRFGHTLELEVQLWP